LIELPSIRYPRGVRNGRFISGQTPSEGQGGAANPPRGRLRGAWVLGALLLLSPLAWAESLPCSPVSEFLDRGESQLDPQFCAAWNPEYGLKGPSCCPKVSFQRSSGSRRRRRPASKGTCGPQRSKASYCEDMTVDQKDYVAQIQSGQADILKKISEDISRRGPQSFCTVNNGFLAWGKPVLGTATNRIHVKNPERCVNFGSDALVGMVEWVGRQIRESFPEPEYAGVKLIVGNVSAPRGGCLTGLSGKRGHFSHTSGRDADFAFFSDKPRRELASDKFNLSFDPSANWWLIKKIFANPYGCVKAVFLDKRLIRKLAKTAGREDPELWRKLSPLIQHVRGHRNHLHVRVGSGPGEPGCPAWESMDESIDEEIGTSPEGLPDSLSDALSAPDRET
jgi:murein endopeptidase